MVTFMTKKDVVKSVIVKMGEPFSAVAVRERLTEMGVSVCPVHVYSAKRELDGLPPYDRRNLVQTRDGAKTKTEIAVELARKSPGITAQQLRRKLAARGLDADSRFLTRVIGLAAAAPPAAGVPPAAVDDLIADLGPDGYARFLDEFDHVRRLAIRVGGFDQLAAIRDVMTEGATDHPRAA
jgi:hypothetical protein